MVSKNTNLILLSGPAGIGKSTWALDFIKEHKNYIILSTDETRYQLFNTYTPSNKEEKQVINNMVTKAVDASNKGLNVIIDTAIISNKSRMKWYNRLKDYFENFTLILFRAPLSLCLMNNNKRERKVPINVIKQMYQHYEVPNIDVFKSFKICVITKDISNNIIDIFDSPKLDYDRFKRELEEDAKLS